MIFCTSGWRTTSTSVNVQNAMPSMPCEQRLAPRRGRSRAPLREIDLGHVAGDHRLRRVAEAGEEHAHLLARGVLRLVEDDEAVVERAAAHERERRDLDLAARDQPLGALDVHHVVQRVVERAQVRVHLLREIARQKAELLAGLDRGARQDDALVRALEQRRAPPSPWPGTSCRCRPARCRT